MKGTERIRAEDVGNPVTLTVDEIAAYVMSSLGLQALPRSTTTALADVDDAINTIGKVAGKAVINTTSGLIVTADGAAADDVWLALDGTTAHTPT